MNMNQLEHPPSQPAPPADAFRFGRNWQRYVDTYLDSDRERIAAESLADLVGDLRAVEIGNQVVRTRLLHGGAVGRRVRRIVELNFLVDSLSGVEKNQHADHEHEHADHREHQCLAFFPMAPQVQWLHPARGNSVQCLELRSLHGSLAVASAVATARTVTLIRS